MDSPRALPTIVVADDDPEMRAVLRDFLSRTGYGVVEASGGGELLDLLARVTASVIILDKEMPGRSGLDLLPPLRSRHPEIPVIVITAFGGPSTRQAAERLGAVGYIEKPFKLSDLLAVIRRAVRQEVSS
ncbi:MAG: response regulator [Candidatus Rokubacteria bacterium]|nr:response regulator [Candidatus Rokubacteria bacterium]